jgi:hypothetical protein
VHLSSLSYNELASAVIDQERMMKADEKKRKRMMLGSAGSGSSSGAHPKIRMVYTPPGGQLCRPQQQQNWVYRPQIQPRQFLQQQPQQQQQFNRAPTLPPQQFPANNFPSFNCRKMGHFARECHLPKQSNSHELRHLWSIIRGAIRRVLHHGRLVPTIPPWRRFPREKKC